MQERPITERIETYRDSYSQLYEGLKWKADKHTLMMIAAMYVTNSKEFHLKKYLDIAEYIKDNVGAFSYLKSAQRFSIAATLDTTTDDGKTNFHRFIEIYEKLIKNGFSRNAYSYIAAGTLLKVEPIRIDEIVQKTGDIYKGMKGNHFFLTSSSDYPLASILALCENDAEAIVNNVEEYYQALQEKGFSSGNDLQFLSHILALDSEHIPDAKAQQCWEIKELLHKANLKTKKVYYPYVGMLSFLENKESVINDLLVINEELNRDKLFKWNKEINFMMSVLFLMSSMTVMGDAARTGLTISIEALIQAQQAAMTASITAATVAASSSNGNT
ncbi:DUF4003 family protein [Bacillus salipaludis]|uniref:DUF4003 family protein n=1 Tax=Bacillus salipaludis TaxID=2547811 RepID=A0ABW8RDW4_9BACI